MATISSSSILPCLHISKENKRLYLLSLNDKQYYAIYSNDLCKPIVYDERFHEDLLKHNWYKCNEYASYQSQYMHREVARLAQFPHWNDKKYSVDHINCMKLDNRIDNLRMATQGEQNSNRDARCDKKEPSEELKKEGIVSLPKYVRWDNKESKFIIDKHPRLVQEVAEGIRKKACQSGTKSSKLSIKQKYQDILARLEDLNNYINADSIEFEQKKAVLLKEYNMIEKAIKEAEGIVYNEEVLAENTSIEAIRRTCPGKKSESKLPSNCGVTLDMIPKYCYYRVASDKRGDKFIIEKTHPKLIKHNMKGWGTTESRSVPTKEKFDAMIAKLEEL